MSRSEDRRENTLPVTAEIGAEGGSYADPTIQVPTFHEDVPRTDETLSDAPLIPADPEPTPRLRRDTSE